MHKLALVHKGISRFLELSAPDDISKRTLSMALNKIIRTLKINTQYDVPYLAGYNKTGTVIYIDRNLPKSMCYRGKRVNIQRYLVLHEIVEKSLIDQLGHLHYQLAHQIATRAEKAAVEGEGVSWKIYNSFMQDYIASLRKEKEYHVPKDLDLKPYKDDKDKTILKRLKNKR